MNTRIRTLAFTVAAVVLLAPAGFAQSTSDNSAISLFGRSARPGQTLEQYLERRNAEFYNFDIDDDGVITETDLTLHRQHIAAMARSWAMRELLQFDLDGDGVVTRAEVKTSLNSMLSFASLIMPNRIDAVRHQIDAAVDQRMRADTNGDDRIDGAEILAFARQHATPKFFRGNALLWVAMTVDQNKDGRVTRDEYLKAAETAFRMVDTNGDGTLSKEELGAFQRQNMPPPASRQK